MSSPPAITPIVRPNRSAQICFAIRSFQPPREVILSVMIAAGRQLRHR